MEVRPYALHCQRLTGPTPHDHPAVIAYESLAKTTRKEIIMLGEVGPFIDLQDTFLHIWYFFRKPRLSWTIPQPESLHRRCDGATRELLVGERAAGRDVERVGPQIEQVELLKSSQGRCQVQGGEVGCTQINLLLPPHLL
jgi:hypothetical protein